MRHTINDNGIVFGIDCSNLSSPRIVSLYGHGDFIVTWVGSLLFDGNELYLGGSLGFTYPVEQVDMSLPFDNINQYFPPLALQSIPSPSQTYSSARGKHPASSNPARRFSIAAARARTNIINRNAASFSPEAATRFFLQRSQVPSVQ